VIIYQILEEAGLPAGVVNLVSGDSRMITDVVLSSPDLAGIHFTGSTQVFQSIWSRVGNDIAKYKAYPRLVGETGGKDFIVAHPSADPQEVAVAIARGGFEYQGQKCSAASRVYLPKSLAPDIIERTVAIMKDIKIGDPADFRNFMGAVISESSFDKIAGYIDHARKHNKVIAGGGANKEHGYFIEPTIVEVGRPGRAHDVRGDLRACGHDTYVYPDDARGSRLLKTRRCRLRPMPSPAPSSARDRAVSREASPHPATGRGQLLHQRQTHRSGGRPAAVSAARAGRAPTTRPGRR
jgi:1-pyrroline-5-carboxylate dehydrogenase